MTHQIQNRAVQHRRGLLVRRQNPFGALNSIFGNKNPTTTAAVAPATQPVPTLIPTIDPVAPTQKTPTVTPTLSRSDTTTTTSLTSTSSTVSSVSTNSTSTTTASTSITTSSSSTSTTPTPTLSTTTTTTPPPPSSTLPATATSSQIDSLQSSQPSPSKAISTGTLVGIVGGSVAGVVVIAIIVAFIVRRMRKKSLDRDAFNATHFRRSAFLLDDTAEPYNSNTGLARSGSGNSSGTGHSNGHGYSHKPRPPTMIERHLAHAPTMPSAAYGGDYAYTGIQNPYAADNQYSQFTAEQYGRGGAGGEGAYGPYAAYAAQQQHPQYPQQQQPRYQQQQQPPQQHYPGMYSMNSVPPPAPPPRPAPGTTPSNLPNPFTSGVMTTAAAAVAAAHSAAAAPSVRSGSTSPPVPSGRPLSQGSQSSSSGTYVNRQPTIQKQQPQQQAVYADVQRDAKTPHPTTLMVRNGTPTPDDRHAPGAGASMKSRDTVYDFADAYGGI